MKQLLLIALLLIGMTQQSFGKEGYHIHLKMPGVKDSMVFLAHYYGVNRPKIFKSDSAHFKNGEADLKSNDPDFVGGIYIIFLSDYKTNFEVLMSKGDDMTITAAIKDFPEDIKFTNSAENTRFEEYVKYLKSYGEQEEKYKKELAEAKTADDTAAIRKKAVASSKELNKYRSDYENKYPGTLLTKIFKGIETPEIPEGEHLLEDGKTKDSTFAYRFYKKHYWDGYDFQDDRLIYTPLYDAKLEEYFSKLVLPWTDSVEKEGDMILKKTRGTKDQFHYTLWWLTKYVEDSKVMGMDEAFVYFVENYYMKGDASWLTNEELTKYIDRAQKIAPNVIGNLSPELKLPNVETKKEESVHGLKAKYTLVLFYSPNCGHCQHEIPKLDSAYRASLKDKGLRIFTVATETDDTTIMKFVKKNNMQDWTNTWDPDHTSNYHNSYDVYSTPTIYLLDDKKIIKGKRLDHSNIGGLIDMIEKNKAKEKEKAKEGAKP